MTAISTFTQLLSSAQLSRVDDVVEVLLYVHRNRRLIRDESPEQPLRLLHSSWAPCANGTPQAFILATERILLLHKPFILVEHYYCSASLLCLCKHYYCSTNLLYLWKHYYCSTSLLYLSWNIIIAPQAFHTCHRNNSTAPQVYVLCIYTYARWEFTVGDSDQVFVCRVCVTSFKR